MSFLASPSGIGSTHTSFTRWCDPPRGKHRQLARQVGVLRVFHRFPIPFQMATLVMPISRSTVIWFGSLEFMFIRFGYDMILPSVKGPGGARVEPAQLRAPRRPHHHASPPKKRRGQHHHTPLPPHHCHRTDQIIRVQVQKRSTSNQVSKLEPI